MKMQIYLVWKHMLDKRFLKSVAAAFSGGVAVQLVGLLAAPFITRLYSPDVYGSFSSLLAYSSLLAPLMIFSYSIVLVLPKKDKDAFSILTLTSAVATLITLLLIILLQLFNINFIFGDISSTAILALAWNVTIIQAFSYWFIRKEEFLLRSKYLILQAIVVASCKIILGKYYPNIDSLYYSTLIPGIILIIFLSFYLYKKNVSYIKSNKIFIRGFINIKTYFHIVKYRTPQNMLASFNNMLPLFAIPLVFNLHYVGIFALTRTVLMLPGNLISTSIGDVIFPRLNNAVNNNVSISKDIKKIIIILTLLGVFPLLVLNLYGDKLFLYIFGEQWLESGVLSGILSFWVFVNLINKPLIVLIPIFSLERKFLLNSTLSTILGIVCFFISYEMSLTFIDAMKLYTLFLMIPQFIVMMIVYLNVNKYEQDFKI